MRGFDSRPDLTSSLLRIVQVGDAEVVELVDTRDLSPLDLKRRAGSRPALGTYFKEAFFDVKSLNPP